MFHVVTRKSEMSPAGVGQRCFEATRLFSAGLLAMIVVACLLVVASPNRAQGADPFQAAPGPVPEQASPTSAFQAAPGPSPQAAKPSAHAAAGHATALGHPTDRVVIQKVIQRVYVPQPILQRVPQVQSAPQASPSPATFDGLWWTTMVCPDTPDGRTRGYSRQFVSQVNNGLLQADSGSRGQPGSMSFQGRVNPDGTMQLSGQGLAGSDTSSVAGQLRPGTPFQFIVNGRLAAAGGTGKRLGGRDCDFAYAKR